VPLQGGHAGRAQGTAFAPTAKHIIYLHQSGAPSHIDLFDYKPGMQAHHGQELPGSIRQGSASPA